jgi:hypothetical protein
MPQTYTRKMRLQKNSNNEDNVKKTVKQIVKSMQKTAEQKYFDQFTSLSVTTSGTITNISDITRGTDVTQRVGNEVYLQHLEVNISAYLNANVDSAFLRLMFLVDTMGYNLPVVADVLEPALVGTAYTNVAPYYWEYRKRFRILKDESFHLVKDASNRLFNARYRIPLGFKSYNIGSSTTFKNQIYVLMIGTETNVLNLSNFTYNTRLVFSDE